jgi:hypothetical protein
MIATENIAFYARRALNRAEENSSSSAELMEDLHVLHEQWKRQVSGFNSIQEFLDQFGQEITDKGKGRFYCDVDQWMRYRVIPQRRMKPAKFDMFSSNMTRANTLYHATGSAALDGIARRGAIISSGRAQELGENIETGEHRMFAIETGLTGVNSTPWFNSDWCLARWFDEYHIVFGLDTDKVEVEREGVYTILSPEVSIDAVKLVHTEDQFKTRVQSWLMQQGLDVPVLEMAYIHGR